MPWRGGGGGGEGILSTVGVFSSVTDIMINYDNVVGNLEYHGGIQYHEGIS